MRYTALRRAATFLLAVIGWVLFRSADLGQAGDVYAAMLSPSGGELPPALDQALVAPAVCALVLGLLSTLLPRDVVMGRIVQGRLSGGALAARVATVCLLPLTAISVAAGSFSPFLYFQF